MLCLLMLCSLFPGPLSDRPRGSFKARSMTQSKVTAWLMDSHGLEYWNKGKGQVTAWLMDSHGLEYWNKGKGQGHRLVHGLTWSRILE